MDSRNLEWLFSVLQRMHMNCLKSRLAAQGLPEIHNPPLFFLIGGKQRQGIVYSQKQLADKLGVSPASIAVSLARMERARLIERRCDCSDNRCKQIRLSAAGLRLMQESQQIIHSLNRDLFAGFSAEECEALRGYYLRMIQNLEALGVATPESIEGDDFFA